MWPPNRSDFIGNPTLLKHCLRGLLAITVFGTSIAHAQGPLCLPCAGIRTDDPGALLADLEAEPRLSDAAVLYVAWATPLVDDDDAHSLAIANMGATPLVGLVFRTPSPLAGNLEML